MQKYLNQPRLLLIVLVATLATGGVITLPLSGISISVPKPLSSRSQPITLAEYERLDVGMTLTDAQATLGRAVEVSRDEKTATYRWTNSNGSGITAIFRDGRLVSKTQSELQ
jgi:hypothetical protein